MVGFLFFVIVVILRGCFCFAVSVICKLTLPSHLGSDFTFCDTAVDEELMRTAHRLVTENATAYFRGPFDHLDEYLRNYEYLIDGRAASDVAKFLAVADRPFEEYVEEVAKYRRIAKEIMALPALRQYQMVRLDCEELKRGLAGETENHAKTLLRRIADNYLKRSVDLNEKVIQFIRTRHELRP